MKLRRHLFLERSQEPGKNLPCIHVEVDDQAAIGPWIATFAMHLGYPLVDRFGAPVVYRLRSASGAHVLPTTGHFADARFSSGSHFVLEPDRAHTGPIQEPAQAAILGTQTHLCMRRLSRRSLMSSGLLTACSLLGLSSGLTTAVAQHLLFPPRVVTPPYPLALRVHTTLTLHQRTIRTVVWSPDGSRIASGGNDGMGLIWHVDGGLLQTLRFQAPVRALAWSPDGRQLAAGAANTVSFFDPSTATLLAADTTQHTAAVTSLGWANEPGMAPLALSAGADKRAVVWSGQGHQPLLVFREHTQAIEALAVRASTVATVSQGGVARLWNASTGQEIHGYYAATQHSLRAVAFSSGGALALGGDDGVVYLWHDGQTCTHSIQDLFGWHCVDEALRLHGHRGAVRAIAFSPDGTRLATGGEDRSLIIWSLQTLKPLLIFPQQDALVALSWSPSGQMLAGALGTRVVLWQRQG